MGGVEVSPMREWAGQNENSGILSIDSEAAANVSIRYV